jgi:hypothetical protein
MPCIRRSAGYSPLGREPIPPERLMRALLLQAFYSIRSERQLVERIDTDLLFRWFVGLGIEALVWDATTFTKNRHQEPRPAARRRGGGQVSRRGAVARQGQGVAVERAFLGRWDLAGGLGQPEELPPQGRLGRPRQAPGRNGERDLRDFHGERRKNDTHASTTDPDARLFRQS